jgi:hypothetical protein
MFNAVTPAEIDVAFHGIVQKQPDALLVGTDPFFLDQRAQIIARASQLKIPTIYLSFPKIPSGPDSRGEAESFHHLD